MKRILFIDAGDPYKKIQERFYPLWPSYLASYVEKHIGQFEFRYMSSLSIEKELKSFKPHLVAISSVSSNYNYAIKYSRIVKNYGLPVIIGGIHISSLPNNLTKDMDVGCIGEGGYTFVELICHYLNYGEFKSEGLGDIKGIVFRDNGRLKLTTSRPLCESLDELPHPKRSVIGYHRWDTMLTSCGCPYKCIFCSACRYWKNIRYASSEHVMEEIAELADNGVKVIKFYDELFISNKKRLMVIADSIVKNKFRRKLKFACWARSSSITPEVVEILKSMNIVAVAMGLESGCNRTLKYLKGENVTVEINRHAVYLLNNAGIQANASFIIGSPDETEEEIMQTYNFIKRNRLDAVTVNPLIPFPGTPVWEYAAKKNLVFDDMDWDRIFTISLSERLNNEKIAVILKKFYRLCLIKRLKALPKSPWLAEAPRYAILKLAWQVLKLGKFFANAFHYLSCCFRKGGRR